MAIITSRHAQNIQIARAIPRIAEAVEAKASLQGQAARNGSPPVAPKDGHYDDAGVWQSFLRLDIDPMTETVNGPGCAP